MVKVAILGGGGGHIGWRRWPYWVEEVAILGEEGGPYWAEVAVLGGHIGYSTVAITAIQ
jgi:hypothetical protein